MKTNERKQDIALYVSVAAVFITLAASIYMMSIGNYVVRTASFVLVLAAALVMPVDKMPAVIALLFPIVEIVRLSEDSRTVLPFVIILYILKVILAKKYNFRKLVFFIIPYSMFVAVNVINGVMRFDNFASPLVTCVFILFAFFFGSQKRNDKTNSQIAAVYIISAAFTAVESVVFKDVALMFSTANEYTVRFSGFSSPWNFGLCMLLGWFFVVYLFEKRKIGYILLVAGSVFFVYFAGETGTRSLLVGMAVVVAYIAVSIIKRTKKLSHFLRAVIVFSIPVFAIVYWLFILEPMLESRGNMYDGARVELWSYYLNLFLNDKLVLFFGIGCNDLPLYAKSHNMLTAHNIFIEMLVELGIVGIILFIILISFILKKANKNPLKNEMMLPLIIYLSFMLTQSGLSTELLYFVIALAGQVYYERKNEKLKDYYE